MLRQDQENETETDDSFFAVRPKNPLNDSKNVRIQASREASYFHDEHDVKNGVIVECNWAKSDIIKQTVVNFATHTSAYATESCFKHREWSETRSQFYKDERPYEVFENVNYEADENGMVTSRISRNQKKWECQNMGNDVFAVKAKCVFSFKDKRCDTDIIENVEFDPEIFHTQVLCQNVTYNCWLQFIFTKSTDIDPKNPKLQSVHYKLHSLEEVNPEAYDFARRASWSKKKVATAFYEEDYDPYASAIIVNPDHQKTHQAIKAYMLDECNIFIPTKPRWRVSLAFNKAQSLLINAAPPLQPHDPLYVDIRYNPVVERYIVFNASRRLDGRPLAGRHYIRDDVYYPGNKVHVHKVEARPVLGCHGYFTFGNNHLVFDPNGCLIAYYNDTSCQNIPIEIVYVDPEERDITQLAVYYAESVKDYNLGEKKYVGLCIKEGELYCSELHFLALNSFDADMVGGWYEFTILNLDYENRVATVDAFIIPEKSNVLMKTDNNIHEFLFDIKFPLSAICVAGEIGPVGVTDAQLETINNKKAASVIFPDLKQFIRPNVRPFIKTAYRTYEDGMRLGAFQ